MMFLRFISGSQRLASHLTRSLCPPQAQAISERNGARELCSSPLDSRLYINSWEHRCRSEPGLLFVFSLNPFLVSLVENKETVALFMSLLDLLCSFSVGHSVSASPRHLPSSSLLYFLVFFLNRPFLSTAVFPPSSASHPLLFPRATVHRMLQLLGIIPIG